MSKRADRLQRRSLISRSIPDSLRLEGGGVRGGKAGQHNRLRLLRAELHRLGEGHAGQRARGAERVLRDAGDPGSARYVEPAERLLPGAEAARGVRVVRTETHDRLRAAIAAGNDPR